MLSLFLFAPAPAAGQGAPDPTTQLMTTLLMFGGVIVVFYFFMIRPQQKRQKEMRKMLDAVKKGDKVVTSSGIHGTVTDVEDAIIVVQIADNTRVRFDKAAIAGVENK